MDSVEKWVAHENLGRGLRDSFLCFALTLGCLGRRMRKLNNVGLLKCNNVIFGSNTHKADKKRFLFLNDKSC